MTVDPYLSRTGRGEEPDRTAAELGVAELDGDWISVTRLGHGVARVRTRRTDPTLVVRAYGGGEPRPGDWGEAEADGVFGLRSGAGYAFTATFDGAPTSVEVQTNQAHGVFAVHAFHRFVDGSGRRDYFTREFYVPAAPGRADHDGGARHGDAFPAALLAGTNDPAGLLGRWTVLDAANAGIVALECALAGGAVTVRAYGAGADGRPVDWGVAGARLYADAARPGGTPAFLATFDLADRRVRVQARDYNGVLVVAQYTAFTDGGGRPGSFTRDCFRR